MDAGFGFTGRSLGFSFITIFTFLTITVQAQETGIFSGILDSLTSTLQAKSCPGECVHTLTALFCERVLEKAECESSYHRCCVPNDHTGYGTVVETSPPLQEDGVPSPQATESDSDTFDHIGNSDALETATGSPVSLPPPFMTTSTESTTITEATPTISLPKIKCPGLCVEAQFSRYCARTVPNGYCPDISRTCCLPDNINVTTAAPTENKFSVTSASPERPPQDLEEYSQPTLPPEPEDPPCPGSCVVGFFSLLCDKTLSDRYCEGGGTCCIKGQDSTTTTTEKPTGPCPGNCILTVFSGVCNRPSELILDTADCGSGTICCYTPPHAQKEIRPGPQQGEVHALETVSTPHPQQPLRFPQEPHQNAQNQFHQEMQNAHTYPGNHPLRPNSQDFLHDTQGSSIYNQSPRPVPHQESFLPRPHPTQINPHIKYQRPQIVRPQNSYPLAPQSQRLKPVTSQHQEPQSFGQGLQPHAYPHEQQALPSQNIPQNAHPQSVQDHTKPVYGYAEEQPLPQKPSPVQGEYQNVPVQSGLSLPQKQDHYGEPQIIQSGTGHGQAFPESIGEVFPQDNINTQHEVKVTSQINFQGSGPPINRHKDQIISAHQNPHDQIISAHQNPHDLIVQSPPLPQDQHRPAVYPHGNSNMFQDRPRPSSLNKPGNLRPVASHPSEYPLTAQDRPTSANLDTNNPLHNQEIPMASAPFPQESPMNNVPPKQQLPFPTHSPAIHQFSPLPAASNSPLGMPTRPLVSQDSGYVKPKTKPSKPPRVPILPSNGNPNCPGPCMAPFLRFTCYGSNAFYNGFSCPKEGLTCCAPIADIQKHEEMLRPSAIKNATLSISTTTENSITTTSTQSTHIVLPATRRPTRHMCGVKGTKRLGSGRVVGGSEASSDEWCWQVALLNTQNQYLCGGSLIGAQWVLTAAHCVTALVRNGETVFVRVGDHDLKSNYGSPRAQTQKVITTYIHHNHNGQTLDNDVALLKLQTPVEVSDGVCVVCLPARGSKHKIGQRCTVTGYGYRGETGPIALKVHEADIPIVAEEECVKQINEVTEKTFNLPANSFCAGGEEGNDACQGDGGGPLVCKSDNVYELTGLVSWGFGCGRSNVPGVYVKVSSFIGWINQIISVNSS